MRSTVVTDDVFADIAHAAFGRDRGLTQVARVTGGSKKGVYRLSFADDSTVIVYIWDASENYWSPYEDDVAEPFTDANGIDLFEAAHRRLSTLGLRVPEISLLDASRQRFPAQVAVVEDFDLSLETLLERDQPRAELVVAELGDSLKAMAGDRAERFGKVVHLDRGGRSNGVSCEKVVLDRALRDLDEAGSRDPRIGRVQGELAELLGDLAAPLSSRTEFGLIHGELAPGHVLIDRADRPVLIDIEGLMYFDVEWEHVFLRLLYGAHYERLRNPELDPQRMRFYSLALHLSLVAGPLRLLDGDFPRRGFMLGIVESNLRHVLSFLPAS